MQYFRKRAKKGQKCAKFENILKKGSLMDVTIAHIKQLEYALVYYTDMQKLEVLRGVLVWSRK